MFLLLVDRDGRNGVTDQPTAHTYGRPHARPHTRTPARPPGVLRSRSAQTRENVSKLFAPLSAVNKEHPFVDKYLFFHFTIDEDKFEEVKKSITPENTLEEQAKEVLRELALVGPDALFFGGVKEGGVQEGG